MNSPPQERADCGLRGLDLLDHAIAHIEAHPETWYQGAYRCKSSLCLAGHVAEMAGGQWAEGLAGGADVMTAQPDDREADVRTLPHIGPVIHVGLRAERLLGFSRIMSIALAEKDQRDREDRDFRDLFDALNTLDDIRAMRDDLRGHFARTRKQGTCCFCGRRRYLADDGRLPSHSNLAATPCDGSGTFPYAVPVAGDVPAEVTP